RDPRRLPAQPVRLRPRQLRRSPRRPPLLGALRARARSVHRRRSPSRRPLRPRAPRDPVPRRGRGHAPRDAGGAAAGARGPRGPAPPPAGALAATGPREAALLRALDGGWHSAPDLAARMGVSVRTVNRDLVSLHARGLIAATGEARARRYSVAAPRSFAP